MDYPSALRSPFVDVLHGHSVPDPYRWLEEEDSPQTLAWCAAQDDLFESYVGSLDRLADGTVVGPGALVRWLGEAWVERVVRIRARAV